jgi:hypothetical protein
MTKSIPARPAKDAGSTGSTGSTDIFGELVEGIDIPVFNERAVRAAAGLLFLFGGAAFATAALTENYQPLRAFGFFFMVDMMLRLFVSVRFTPSMFLGALVVRRQRPEWVGAKQKKLAWGLGLGMAFTSCIALGFLGVTGTLMLALCGLCLSLLFLESAFGICIGCELHRLFAKEKPQLCPGDTCNYTPPTRANMRTR